MAKNKIPDMSLNTGTRFVMLDDTESVFKEIVPSPYDACLKFSKQGKVSRVVMVVNRERLHFDEETNKLTLVEVLEPVTIL